MSENHKIKDISPQFDVILRRKPGSVATLTIYSGSIGFEKEKPRAYEKNFYSPDENSQVIQIVKRITDDKLFHQADLVKTFAGDGYIIEFKEDLITCKVAFIFAQKEKNIFSDIEINDLLDNYEQVDVGEKDI